MINKIALLTTIQGSAFGNMKSVDVYMCEPEPDLPHVSLFTPIKCSPKEYGQNKRKSKKRKK